MSNILSLFSDNTGKKAYPGTDCFPMSVCIVQNSLTLGRDSYHRYNMKKRNPESFQCPWGGLHRQYQSPAALGGQGC